MASPCTERALRRLPAAAREKPILIVQHIRRDTQSAVLSMRAAGLQVPLVLGVSYSVDAEAHAALLEAGVSVEIHGADTMTRRLADFLETAASGQAILVDVGGYGAPLAAAQASAARLAGVVEETNNGLWRYEQTKPLAPVVQIARCPNKALENVRVGEAIVHAAISALQAGGLDERRHRFTLLGYGGIGENVAHSLARRGLDLAVFDPKPQRRMLAHARGFAALPRPQALARATVIIGCSGEPSLLAADASLLRGNVILMSGSSKAIEFSDYVAGNRFSDAPFAPGVAAATDGRVLLVNRGEPINFVYGSLPLELGDFQFANIVGGIDHLIRGQPGPGVHELASSQQIKIAQDWLDVYGIG